VTCQVCRAPSLPMHGVCVFCHSPLGAGTELGGLLDYLAGSLPGIDVKRRGLVRKGPVRELRSGEHRARLGRAGLALTPDRGAAQWVDSLLSELSRKAAADGGLRQAMTRAGWAFR